MNETRMIMNYNNVRLSPHFMLGEFLNLGKYPENIPSMQDVVNLTYGCHQLLEPARLIVGPIIINSGYRNEIGRFLQVLGIYRPASDGKRLASYLLEPLRSTTSLCPDRVLYYLTKGLTPCEILLILFNNINWQNICTIQKKVVPL